MIRKLEKLPLKWVETIINEHSQHNFNFEEYCDSDFVLILQDCLLYQHPELVQLAFKLLNIHFSQRKLLI